MLVRLLGAVDVTDGDGMRPVPGLRRKAVLAALALHPGEIVGSDRLVELVWGDSPSPAAATTLQSHVSQLRGLLGERSSIVAELPGYRLNLGPEPTDVRVAERLVKEAARDPDPARAADLLRTAIALWRGTPLAELVGLPWFAEQSARLTRLRDQARRTLLDRRLGLGEHAELVPDLSELALREPYDEEVHRQLMLSLYRAGRQGEALAAYERLRRILDEELGILPGQPLRDLESAVRRGDPALDAPVQVRPKPPEGARPPAQLPLPTANFTGRAESITRLDGLLTGAADRPAEVAVCVLTGTAGIGKTSLAVHWAHRVADRFPDGQLYVNLRGFDPDGPALEYADVLRGFLDAFGVPGRQIPAGRSERGALFRTLVAGRRVLVILDNARDAEQVRPLLPGTPGCLAVVTSRNRLTGLVAAEGADQVRLDLFSPAEARELLASRLGPDRTVREPDAVDDLVDLCARLPLALSIAAARAVVTPGIPLSALVDELRHASTSLDALDGGDAAADIRAVFSWSLRTVSPAAARLFRLLGVHPGPDLTTAAAASLAAATVPEVRTQLAELTRAHLVFEHAPGRYAFHDLLRSYATEQPHGPRDEPDTAIRRMLDHYVHTAHAAAVALNDTRRPIPLDRVQPGVVPEVPDGLAGALAWFGAEHRVLLATVDRAETTGRYDGVWRLAWALGTYLLRQGHWPEQVALQHRALEAARRLGEKTWAAETLHTLARTHIRLGGYDVAGEHFQDALDLCVGTGDLTGQAHNHGGLAEIAEQRDRPADALRHNEHARDLFRSAGDRSGEASALNGMGWCLGLLGDHAAALVACTEAIELLLVLDDQENQAATWDSLGCIHRNLADYERAYECHHRSVEMCRTIGERYWEASALANFGDTHAAAGDDDSARTVWGQALEILEELDHPDATVLRAKVSH